MAKAKKEVRRYPEEIPFKAYGFDWVIKFMDIETENHGITDSDAKVVHIYYKNKSAQNVIETVIHELKHVEMYELADPIFLHEVEKPYAKEENMVRLTSPRQFAFFRDNPHVIEFIMKEIGKLDDV